MQQLLTGIENTSFGVWVRESGSIWSYPMIITIHAYGMAMLAGLSDEEHIAHRAYAQHHLLHLFQLAPFIRRALKKPLGYAGDYEMMNMLYRPSQNEGTSLFAKVLNLCAATEVAARANINRISFLGERLRSAVRRVRQEGGTRARICSVGCGPAREIETLLTTDPEIGQSLDVLLSRACGCRVKSTGPGESAVKIKLRHFEVGVH